MHLCFDKLWVVVGRSVLDPGSNFGHANNKWSPRIAAYTVSM